MHLSRTILLLASAASYISATSLPYTNGYSPGYSGGYSSGYDDGSGSASGAASGTAVVTSNSTVSANTTTTDNTSVSSDTPVTEVDSPVEPAVEPDDDLVTYPEGSDMVVTQALPSTNAYAAFEFAGLISGDTDCLKSYWQASKDSGQQCSDDTNAEPTAAGNDTVTGSMLGACLCAQVPYSGYVPPRTIDFDTYVQCCDNIGRSGVRSGFTAACQSGTLTITQAVRGTSTPVTTEEASASASVEVSTGGAIPGSSVTPMMVVLSLAFIAGTVIL